MRRLRAKSDVDVASRSLKRGLSSATAVQSERSCRGARSGWFFFLLFSRQALCKAGKKMQPLQHNCQPVRPFKQRKSFGKRRETGLPYDVRRDSMGNQAGGLFPPLDSGGNRLSPWDERQLRDQERGLLKTQPGARPFHRSLGREKRKTSPGI